MENVTKIIQLIAVVPGLLSVLLSVLLFLRLHWPAPALWFLKLYVSALSPILLLIGAFTTIVGLTTGSVFISLVGIYSVLAFSGHVLIVTRPPGSSSDFEKAFGLHWEDKINPEQKITFFQGDSF